MGVNRSGYYKWKKRKNSPSKRTVQIEKDIELIKEIHKHHPSHGYRWIRAYALRHYGVIWSNNHVHNCCKYAGIISTTRSRKRKI